MNETSPARSGPPRRRQVERLAGLIGRQLPSPGHTTTSIDGLSLYRADQPTPIRCALYDPCLILVAQGTKRGQVGEVVYEYSPARYLVLPVSLPIEAQVVEASPQRPFLSLAVRIEAQTLGEIMVGTGTSPRQTPETGPGIAVSSTTDELLDAAVRLLDCLDSEADGRVLAPQIQREMLYRVLNGPQGDLLRSLGSQDSNLAQISRALGLIHAQYQRALSVPELARAAHMSESTFYEAFRTVTTRSPLQYLKEVRLNRARQILLWEATGAQQAALRVGYRSASQFSREFKRRFGRAPSRERQWALSTGELGEPQPG